MALAPALARSPRLLVLDEPFSALDSPVRYELRRELRRLGRETGVATVLVTHDPEEAALLAEEVIVIAEGRAIQAGATGPVFSRPASPQAARLLGVHNLRQGPIVEPGHLEAGGAMVTADTGPLASGTRVWWSIRPERVRVCDGAGPLGGVFTDVADLGTVAEATVQAGSSLELQARAVGDGARWIAGQRCHLELPVEAITLWADGQPASEGVDPLAFAP